MKPLTAYLSAVLKRIWVLCYLFALDRNGKFEYQLGCLGLLWLMLAACGFAPVGISLWQMLSPRLQTRSDCAP
jgi:hypothetical protein